MIAALLLACAVLWGCAPKSPDADGTEPQEAAEFEEACRALGFLTISMRDEFEAIYKSGAVKTETALQPAA